MSRIERIIEIQNEHAQKNRRDHKKGMKLRKTDARVLRLLIFLLFLSFEANPFICSYGIASDYGVVVLPGIIFLPGF